MLLTVPVCYMLHVFIFITVFLKFCFYVKGKDDVQRAGSHQRSHLPQDSNQSKATSPPPPSYW
jgi:hypothetical protein